MLSQIEKQKKNKKAIFFCITPFFEPDAIFKIILITNDIHSFSVQICGKRNRTEHVPNILRTSLAKDKDSLNQAICLIIAITDDK